MYDILTIMYPISRGLFPDVPPVMDTYMLVPVVQLFQHIFTNVALISFAKRSRMCQYILSVIADWYNQSR